MIKYIAKRLGVAIATLFVILFILFMMLELMPGSPFNDEKLSDEQIAVLNEKYGLDDPVLKRFGNYVVNMATGDFGVSYVIQVNMPIRDMLISRFPLTIRIGLQAILVGVFFGLILGIFAALKHNSIFDTGATLISMLGASVSSYVFALGLVYFLAFKAGWFPLLYTSKQEFMSTVLPTIALGMGPISSIARFSRSEMIEVMGSEYMLLAEAKGIDHFRRIIIHALRNALIPILTIIAPMLVGLITGSTVVENIFSIPGIGNLFVNAIQVNDYNVVMALAFVFSAMYIFMMLAVDILYGVIDPRIRLAGGDK